MSPSVFGKTTPTGTIWYTLASVEYSPRLNLSKRASPASDSSSALRKADTSIAGADDKGSGAELHETVRAGNAAIDAGDGAAVVAAARDVTAMLSVLGLDQAETAGTAGAETVALDALVRTMIDQRADARATKDWATADRIRDAIAAAGIVLEDGPEGTHWSVNRG